LKICGHGAALAFVVWYLMLPAQVPESGTANASPVPIAASTFAVYDTAKQCESERRQLLDDPVVGARMAYAECVPMTTDGPKSRESK
jgi:hypothetical protein